jgi:hypothetical protein
LFWVRVRSSEWKEGCIDRFAGANDREGMVNLGGVVIGSDGQVDRQTARAIMNAFDTVIHNIAYEPPTGASGIHMHRDIGIRHLTPLFNKLKVGRFSLEDGISRSDLAERTVKTWAFTKNYSPAIHFYFPRNFSEVACATAGIFQRTRGIVLKQASALISSKLG